MTAPRPVKPREEIGDKNCIGLMSGIFINQIIILNFNYKLHIINFPV